MERLMQRCATTGLHFTLQHPAPFPQTQSQITNTTLATPPNSSMIADMVFATRSTRQLQIRPDTRTGADGTHFGLQSAGRILQLELVKVLVGHLFERFLFKEIGFATFDRQIGRRMFGTKRPQQNGITLQFVKRFIERLWQTTDTETLQFCLAEIPWINILRLARINLVLDAIQTRRNQAAQCKIGITD